MTINVSLHELLDYTDWERKKWQDWLKERDDAVLKTSAGPNSDERFKTVGEVIRHVFSAEKRYVDRLSDRVLTDTSSVPADNVEALFAFGLQSRKELRELLKTFPVQNWDAMREFDFFGNTLRATPRKIITHVVMHEIRHWAQIATLLRLNGLTDRFHDFLFSPVMGGDLRRGADKTSA